MAEPVPSVYGRNVRIQGALLKKVSITDVARHAGVSVSTVSLVLRRKGNISESTTRKVHTSIGELGYIHNVTAANLRASTSNLIGLILPNFNDSFSVQVMSSIVRELETQGFMVFLAHPLNEYEHLEHCLLSFKQQRVAGIIYLASDTCSDTLPAQIRQCSLPLVAISQSPIRDNCNRVIRDNQQAAYLATHYLLGRGHRYIAYIGGQEHDLVRQQRLAGFHNAMAHSGILYRDNFSPVCDDNTLAACQATRLLLENKNTITALLCHSLDVMIGCLNGIRQVGRTVGKDIFLTRQVALIGFEDTLYVNLSSPAFTYISSASEKTGRQAANLLIRKIREPTQQTQYVTISGRLILRETA